MVQTAIFTETVTFQRAVIERNGLGEGVETWTTLATRKAAHTDVQDAEAVRAAAVGSQLTARFRVRWSSTISTLNPRDRLVHRSRVYNIVGVKVVERNRLLEISAAAASDVPAVIVVPSP